MNDLYSNLSDLPRDLKYTLDTYQVNHIYSIYHYESRSRVYFKLIYKSKKGFVLKTILILTNIPIIIEYDGDPQMLVINKDIHIPITHINHARLRLRYEGLNVNNIKISQSVINSVVNLKPELNNYKDKKIVKDNEEFTVKLLGEGKKAIYKNKNIVKQTIIQKTIYLYTHNDTWIDKLYNKYCNWKNRDKQESWTEELPDPIADKKAYDEAFLNQYYITDPKIII